MEHHGISCEVPCCILHAVLSSPAQAQSFVTAVRVHLRICLHSAVPPAHPGRCFHGWLVVPHACCLSWRRCSLTGCAAMTRPQVYRPYLARCCLCMAWSLQGTHILCQLVQERGPSCWGLAFSLPLMVRVWSVHMKPSPWCMCT